MPDDKRIVKGSFKNWVFVWNNYTPDFKQIIEEFHNKYASWTIYSQEVGPVGTPHIQGFTTMSETKLDPETNEPWNAKITKNTCMKRMSFAGYHSPKAPDATFEDQVKYISGNHPDKHFIINPTYTCFGEMPQQGARGDLVQKLKDVQAGVNMRTFVTNSNAQQLDIIERYYMKYAEPARDLKEPPRFVYIWGGPGSGKSTYANLISQGIDKHVSSKPTSDWWDKYDGHKCILRHDFRDSWIKYSELLNMIDKFEYHFAIKNSFRQCLADTFIFDSVIPPDELYQGIMGVNKNDTLVQLLRRLTTVIFMKDYQPVVLEVDKILSHERQAESIVFFCTKYRGGALVKKQYVDKTFLKDPPIRFRDEPRIYN